MTKERMQDLYQALLQDGWDVANRTDMYALEGQSITWKLERWGNPTEVYIKFYLFHGLGKRTENLKDIVYCDVIPNEARLFFTKRSDPEWKSNLEVFARELQKIA